MASFVACTNCVEWSMGAEYPRLNTMNSNLADDVF